MKLITIITTIAASCLLTACNSKADVREAELEAYIARGYIAGGGDSQEYYGHINRERAAIKSMRADAKAKSVRRWSW